MMDEAEDPIMGRRREYYGVRLGKVEKPVIDIEKLRKLFLHTFTVFNKKKYYFQEALGYHCVDEGTKFGLWGVDIEDYIYQLTGLSNVWPIVDNYENLDEITIFTLIELLYDYVSKPTDLWLHDYWDCGYHSSKYDREEGRKEFREEINKIINNYEKGYYLSKEGELYELPIHGMEELILTEVSTKDPENIDDIMKDAKNKYFRYGSDIEDKKECIRKLGDVLEFLKKDSIRLESKDESDLFKILNQFSIRHHNKHQQKDYEKEYWYDWFFYTFLASINLLIKKNVSLIR